jgi:phosphonate transport system substrate-binding protein
MKAGKTAQFLFLFQLILMVSVGAALSQVPDDETLETQLRVAVLPDVGHDYLQQKNQLLFQYLTRETGNKIQYIKCNTYEEMLEAFHEKKVDLAWFGGYTFVKAHLQDRAIPLVMRDVDFQFTSYFLVRKNHPATSIAVHVRTFDAALFPV